MTCKFPLSQVTRLAFVEGEFKGVVQSSSALFYGEIVPLYRERHKSFKISSRPDRFEFARRSNVVPALVDEFVAASVHLPIVFMVGARDIVPVFLVGLRSGVNALIDKEGAWTGEYIPAYMRRYPFIIGEVKGGEPLICVDEGSPLLKDEEGEALFDGGGKETPTLLERIRFSNDFFRAAEKNASFVAILTELELLQSVSIDAKFDGGEALSIQGFLTVDSKRFDALPDEAFLRLRTAGFLAPIYAHLISMNNADRIRRVS